MSETATLPLNIDAPAAGAGDFYEVINGQVVEPPEMGAFESLIATLLTEAISQFFASEGRLGWIAAETLFRIDTESGLQRRPDLAFVSYERWPRDTPFRLTAAWSVVPDLAVEVVSPNDSMLEVMDKLADYFQAGVRQVWVLYPRNRLVYVYESLMRITALDASGTLEGGDVLPGFRLQLADLFIGTA